MKTNIPRRALLTATASSGAFLAFSSMGAAHGETPAISASNSAIGSEIAAIETKLGGDIYVSLLDTASGNSYGYRENERVLFCSTGKVLLVATILSQSIVNPDLLNRHVPIFKKDILAYAPFTSQFVGSTLTVSQLCESTLTMSDNTAANLLYKVCGGPRVVAKFVKSTGDRVTYVNRLEPDLNISRGKQDTTTASAFNRTLEAVTVGKALPSAQQNLLISWMKKNKTGDAQIRAGVLPSMIVADKTGASQEGHSHDVSIIWPASNGLPLVLSIFTKMEIPANTALQKECIAKVANILASAYVAESLL